MKSYLHTKGAGCSYEGSGGSRVLIENGRKNKWALIWCPVVANGGDVDVQRRRRNSVYKTNESAGTVQAWASS